MNYNKAITDLVNVSNQLGLMPDLIQGGGGNTSVKIEEGVMAIKASGYLLRDLKYESGLSYVNFERIT